MRDAAKDARSRLVGELSSADAEDGAALLAACRTTVLEAAVPHFHGAFPAGALLVVEDGFVVLRASAPPSARSVITCEAGAGRIVLPPSAEEVLVGLYRSRLTVIDREARRRLLRVPTLAERVVDELALALEHRQEATANLATPRHVERVRRKLLQLARRYGHVVGDGIRIDFPVSHALLAEMIASSRETVTRALDELQRSGFVARNGSSYRLLVAPDAVQAPVRPHS